ncbi:hypothetical protein J3P77_08935 [Pseudomonas sp. R1-18]|uniref:hypothetical protein n=1 Tax=Pseudomonas sp. R1-18 TaxID=1632772 RepID=UPI003DA85EB3
MRPSIDSLLAWLRVTPRTLGWNAIIAYDRSKTNVVLLQEYIGRFSSDSYLPPLEGGVPTTENEIEWVYDYLIDAPRLSFENSVISASKAKLAMTVMGGSQIGIREEPGSGPAVARVSSYNALQGPKYTVDIDLQVVEGSVDSAGKVQLDLGTGTDPKLYFAPTLNQRTKGGQFMKSKLSSFEPKIKTFVLNEIGSEEGQFLQPRYFVLRTHAEPGARLARAANHGEGAVLLFIAMKDEDNGTLPALDEDLHFLIPAGDFSATVLMGQRFLVRQVLVQGLRRLAMGSAVGHTVRGPVESFAEGIDITSGARPTGEVATGELPNFELFVLYAAALPLASATLNIDRVRERLVFSWTATTDLGTRAEMTDGNYGHSVGLSWRMEQSFKFQVQDESGELKIQPLTEGKLIQCKVSPGDYVYHPEVAEHFTELAQYIEAWLTSELENAMEAFASVAEEIDVFRLESLLFRGANVVKFTRSQDPGDLAMLGELAPGLTQFAISPLEPKTGPAGQVQFKIEPQVAGVSWRVENIPGQTGSPGSIDASGKYTAPGREQIDGQFIRVRVTAQQGEYSNSALVTVLVREILVNPMVQVCGASSADSEQIRELTAGSLGDGPLTWSVAGDSGASVRPSVIEDGDHTFVAGPADPEAAFTMEEVVVTDPAGRTDSAWVLVIHKNLNATIKLQPMDQNRVQLLMDLGDGPLTPEEGELSGLKWTLLKGEGTLNSRGVYQADPDSHYRFAVVVGEIPPPAPIYPAYRAYIILPLPLMELPVLMTALERSDAYFKAVPVLGADRAGKILTGDA